MATINNVTRMLDSKKIPYTQYELPIEKIGAIETAELLNVDPSLVWKSIVVLRVDSPKPILAVIPGNKVVDLKVLAQVLRQKKLRIPTENEAEKLTGLQAGGISPLALLNSGFTIILDESIYSLSTVYISGGQRGLNIRISVADLLMLTGSKTATISKIS